MGDTMYEHDRHRPLEQWFRLNEASTALSVGSEYELTLERDFLEKVRAKVGGFGVVYHCIAAPYNDESARKAVLKHMHYDLSRDENQLPLLNKDLDNEIALIRRVAALSLTPPLLAEFTFKAHESAPSYRMFLQQEAFGQSLYDLKDFMPTSKRIEVLWNIFNHFNVLHKHGLYHTDLDLHHIFWDEDTQSIQIIDWGGGFFSDPSVTGESDGRKLKHGGKEYWVSPEQRKRELYTERSEVFLLGSLVYFFLTNENNGDASPDYENNDNPDGIALDSIRRDEDIPAFLRELVYQAKRWESADRFESVAAMLEFWSMSCQPAVGSILTVHTTSGEHFTVDEKNPEISLDSDLGIVADYSSSFPSWRVDGMCEYLVHHGSSIGEWKFNHSTLHIFQRPMLIRSASSGEVYLVKVARAATSSSEGNDSGSTTLENSTLYRCNSTGDIVVVLDEKGDTISLKNQYTLEVKRIGREDFYISHTEM